MNHWRFYSGIWKKAENTPKFSPLRGEKSSDLEFSGFFYFWSLSAAKYFKKYFKKICPLRGLDRMGLRPKSVRPWQTLSWVSISHALTDGALTGGGGLLRRGGGLLCRITLIFTGNSAIGSQSWCPKNRSKLKKIARENQGFWVVNCWALPYVV